jgi:hypothetical protein
LPSRPGELHPEPLTDPDLNLSIHPARAIARRLPGSSRCRLSRSSGDDLPPSLHGHYPASTLLRSSPPLSGASVLLASRLSPLEPFPLASPCRFSRSIQEPDRNSRHLHAGYRLGCLRHPPSLSRRSGQPSVLTSSNQISTLLQWFAYARLSRPCLTGSSPDFSATFTTMAFDHSSLRWLGIST